MEIKNENGIKRISCDNLGEVITEFKKFRNSKSAKERKNYNFDVWGDFMSRLGFKIVKRPDGKFVATEIVNSVEIYQENGVNLS